MIPHSKIEKSLTDILTNVKICAFLIKDNDQNIKSLNTAKKYMGQLEELGIVVPKKIGKEIVYLNIDLFNLTASLLRSS